MGKTIVKCSKCAGKVYTCPECSKKIYGRIHP